MDDDSLKLRAHILNFLDSTNSCYSVVDNRSFREMLHFLRPDIALPTSMDIISDRWKKTNEDVELYQVDSFQAVPPDLPEPIPESSMTVRQFIQYQKKRMPHLDAQYYKEDVKPEDIIEEIVEDPMDTNFEIDENAHEIPILEGEPIAIESLQQVIYQGINENADRCLVCRQPVNLAKKRKLSIRHGYILKSICVMNNVYPIGEAKEKQARFYSCVRHMQEIYNLVLSTLEIKKQADIVPTNPRIATAFNIVNEIKAFRFGKRQATSIVAQHTFCDNIHNFLVMYGPEKQREERKEELRWPSTMSIKELEEES